MAKSLVGIMHFFCYAVCFLFSSAAISLLNIQYWDERMAYNSFAQNPQQINEDDGGDSSVQ